MQTTYITHNIKYAVPEIQDIIIMIPVMDSLATKYKAQVEEINKQRGKGFEKFEPAIAKAAKTLDQLEILMELGFKTSNNNKDIQMIDELIALTIREERK